MSHARTSVAPQIIDQASEWFVAMREPSVSAEHREAFADWLRASPVHVGAYLEITRLWADSAGISPEFSADATAAQADNVFPLRSEPGHPGASHKHPVSRRLALAASLLAACLLGATAWWHFTRPPTYVADVGEQRIITLEDGSTVKLNSRSRFAVSMTPQQRQVDLLEGEALFEVTHNSSRPFIVTSGEVAIRAVGTQFDVNRKRSGTVVTVVEGRVQVTGPSAGSIFLSAGEQATVGSRGMVARQSKANIGAVTSWLQQELVFEGEPLSAVIEEFNRYSRTPIVLSDPSLADLRINAVFHTTNPDSLLRFVTRFDGVEIERTDNEIRIHRKP
jgi:transmembrane sensor